MGPELEKPSAKWRFVVHAGLFYLYGISFTMSWSPSARVFSTAIPNSSLSESYFCGLQEIKPVCWSWVPPPPREGMKLKRLPAVSMVYVVCFRDNTLNYDWGLPLTQVPPALALHTHSCPGTYCPLRSAQTKCTNIKLFFALNHITVFTLQLLHQSQSKKNLTFVLKYVHYLPQCWIQSKDVLQSKVWRPFSDFWVKLALLIPPK